MNAEIYKKVKYIVGPTNTALPKSEDIVALGPEAMEAAIDLFENPSSLYGYLNQALLATALMAFAKQGHVRADGFLRKVAAGEVSLVGSYGPVALRLAQTHASKPLPSGVQPKAPAEHRPLPAAPATTPGTARQRASSSSPAVPASVAKVFTSCPNCGMLVTTPRQHVGRRGQCPSCQTKFVIPDEPEVDSRDAIALAASRRFPALNLHSAVSVAAGEVGWMTFLVNSAPEWIDAARDALRAKPQSATAAHTQPGAVFIPNLARFEEQLRARLTALPIDPQSPSDDASGQWQRVNGVAEFVGILQLKLFAEARLIRLLMSDVRDVEVMLQPVDPGDPRTLTITLARKFRDGYVDLVPHRVRRVSEAALVLKVKRVDNTPTPTKAITGPSQQQPVTPVVAECWYYESRGIENGPVSSRELKQLAEQGIVLPDTMVRKSAAGRLVRADVVQGLFPPAKPEVPSEKLIPVAMTRFKVPSGHENFLFCLPAFYIAKVDGNIAPEEVKSLASNVVRQGLVRNGTEYQVFCRFANETIRDFVKKTDLDDFTLLASAINALLHRYSSVKARRIHDRICQVCTDVAEAVGPLPGDRVTPEERDMLDRILLSIEFVGDAQRKPGRASSTEVPAVKSVQGGTDQAERCIAQAKAALETIDNDQAAELVARAVSLIAQVKAHATASVRLAIWDMETSIVQLQEEIAWRRESADVVIPFDNAKVLAAQSRAAMEESDFAQAKEYADQSAKLMIQANASATPSVRSRIAALESTVQQLLQELKYRESAPQPWVVVDHIRAAASAIRQSMSRLEKSKERTSQLIQEVEMKHAYPEVLQLVEGARAELNASLPEVERIQSAFNVIQSAIADAVRADKFSFLGQNTDSCKVALKAARSYESLISDANTVIDSYSVAKNDVDRAFTLTNELQQIWDEIVQCQEIHRRAVGLVNLVKSYRDAAIPIQELCRRAEDRTDFVSAESFWTRAQVYVDRALDDVRKLWSLAKESRQIRAAVNNRIKAGLANSVTAALNEAIPRCDEMYRLSEGLWKEAADLSGQLTLFQSNFRHHAAERKKASLAKELACIVSPLNPNQTRSEDIVCLGPEAIDPAIELFRNSQVRDKCANLPVLAAALVTFAKQGHAQADRFLHQVAAAEVVSVLSREGLVALRLADEYVSSLVPAKAHMADSILQLIDKYGMTDPVTLLDEVRKLGDREEIVAALDTIESVLKSGELRRSSILTTPWIEMIRKHA